MDNFDSLNDFLWDVIESWRMIFVRENQWENVKVAVGAGPAETLAKLE